MENNTTAATAIPETLNHEEALTVLINAARIGQEHGAYSLEEAELISKAVKLFVTVQPTEGPQSSGQ